MLEAWSGLLQAFLPDAGASKAEKESLLAQAAVMAPYLDPMMVVLKRWLEELHEAVEEEMMGEEDYVMLKNIFGVIGCVTTHGMHVTYAAGCYARLCLAAHC